MKGSFAALIVVILLSAGSGLAGDEISTSRPGAKAVSLRAMIAAGQVKVGNSNPASEQQLLRTLAVRENTRRAEIEIFRRTEAILKEIKERAESPGVKRLVTIGPVGGGGSVPGTLVDFESGLVVSSLDGFEGTGSAKGRVIVTLLNGRQYRASLRALSVAHNLAVAEPVDDLTLIHDEFTGESENRNARPATLVPGAFLGTMTPDGKWILGSVTSLQHFDESGIDPIVRGSLRRHWESSGIPVSVRRTDLDGAIVCDLPIAAEQCGGPVYTAQQGFVGVIVSRTDQHEAILMPSQLIERLLN